jgi:hypothetical protein
MQDRSDPYKDPLYRVSDLEKVCTVKVIASENER